MLGRSKCLINLQNKVRVRRISTGPLLEFATQNNWRMIDPSLTSVIGLPTFD